MRIRPAVKEDKSRCMDLLNMLGGSVTEQSAVVFDQLLSEERGAVLVAEHEESVIGMITISFNLAIRYGGEYCQVEELIVDPAARGLKAGGALVQASVDCARSRGCAEAGLYLVPESEHNQPFYEKYGFELVGSEMRQRLKER